MRSAPDLWRFTRLNLISSNETDHMKIAARVSNTPCGHNLEVETEGRKQSIAIAPKSIGRGSSINGGELLFAALATCFCNDLYREVAKRGIDVQEVKVEPAPLATPANRHATSVAMCRCGQMRHKPR